jgi:hypothetical protein
MGWYYQATKNSEGIFEVREIYPGVDEDDSLGWTEEAMTPMSESKEGLIEVLQMMLDDVKHYDVLRIDDDHN